MKMKTNLQTAITISSLMTMLLAACSPMPALSSTTPATQLAASHAAGPIEPDAGKWKTWLLKSGNQLRLPAPPDKAATTAEVKELKALAAKRDAKALDQIAFWNTGAPAYRWNEVLIAEALKRNMSSPVSGRALALLHAAIYDATVAAWDSKVCPQPTAPERLRSLAYNGHPQPKQPSLSLRACSGGGRGLGHFGLSLPR